MTEPFVILHLSDTHIGNPKYRTDSIRVFDSLIEDLEKVSKEFSLNPNLIIFSGDLAYGHLPEISLKEQYERAGEFLDKVSNVFDLTPPIFIIPGNHDLNRTIIDDAYMSYRDTLNETLVENMMRDNTDTFKGFLKRQSEWKDFIKTKTSDFILDEALNLISGTINYNHTKIGIVGLNSAWASQGDGEQGKLWIGKNQIERALEKVKDTDFKIAVSHHPYGWLNESENNWIKEKLQSNFQIFLHGHEHSDWFEEHRNHLILSAGAGYQGSKKPNGYSWISIDFELRKAEIYLREYSDKGKAGWKPRMISDKTDDKGRAELDLLFYEKSSGKNSATIIEPSIASPNIVQKPESVNDYINYLDTKFRFIWEPPARSIENAVVFWAVRLRTPTPIHAVQSFVATGLQKQGCEVVLWLDDLGKVDFSAETFFARVDKWFGKVGGNSDLLIKQKINDFINNDKEVPQIWSLVQKWLGTNTTYYLDKVLEVSKLTEPEDNTISQLSRRKPRRLLTPSMVWSGLALLFNERSNRAVITLGGFDEKNLWKAWKECIKDNDTITGHLYTPILYDDNNKPLHMDTSQIGWNSRSDVRNTITNEINKEGWKNEDRLIPWCFNLFSSLPRNIAGTRNLSVEGKEVFTFNELIDLDIDNNNLINLLTDEFTHWLV